MKRLLNAGKYLLILAFGIFLFWWVYKQIPLDQMMDALSGANYSWVLLAIALAILSHISRAMRWKMLIRPLGYHPSNAHSFIAVMVGYLTNVAIPRAGELSRCVILNRTDGIPVNRLLGTVIAERVVDFISLMSIVLITFFIEFEHISNFLEKNVGLTLQERAADAERLLTWWNVFFLLLILVGIIISFSVLRRKMRDNPLYAKFKELLMGFYDGITTIRNLDRTGLFLVHTAFIWIMYFFMTYLVFFALESTEDLGLGAGLTAFSIGSVGFIMPAPGGIGTYHFAVVEALSIYNVGPTTGAVLAFLVHSSQLVMTFVVGVGAYIAFLLVMRKKKHGAPPADTTEADASGRPLATEGGVESKR